MTVQQNKQKHPTNITLFYFVDGFWWVNPFFSVVYFYQRIVQCFGFCFWLDGSIDEALVMLGPLDQSLSHRASLGRFSGVYHWIHANMNVCHWWRHTIADHLAAYSWVKKSDEIKPIQLFCFYGITFLERIHVSTPLLLLFQIVKQSIFGFLLLLPLHSAV